MSPATSWLIVYAVLLVLTGPTAWLLLRSVGRERLEPDPEPLSLPGTVVEHNWRIEYGSPGVRWRCWCGDMGEWTAQGVQAERGAHLHETTAPRTR